MTKPNLKHPLTDEDLDNIEAGARGEVRGIPYPFAHPADTLKLVAEVRRLRHRLNHQTANPQLGGDVEVDREAIREALDRARGVVRG